EKDQSLKAHIESVRNHINGLAGKSYHDLPGINSPDFTIMFVPLESALMAALENDPGLVEFALSQNIGIASPNTMMLVLRTIENLWRAERQIENAEEISKRGAMLYDKFRNFTEDLEHIKLHLDRSQSAVDESIKKLSSGRGNLVSQAEKLRELGVKVKKPIALQSSDDDDPNDIKAIQDQTTDS
ncbi:MAG: DNA recombination protein RmuC, partial [Alphaproteobacteria bacterium]|nr:DNA recombination protein RmuC [Alphaproteobacteria bacterium]